MRTPFHRPLLLALLGASLAVAGCGDDGDDPPSTVDPAAFSRAFEQATGVQLSTSSSYGGTTNLRPVDDRLDARYGSFSIRITDEDDDDRETAVATGGASTRTYPKGVELASYSGARYPEVLERLDRAVRAALAGRPVPVGDRTCAQQRLDLSGAREGSCWQDGRRITVANAGTVLQTSALRAKLEGASTRQVLPRAESFLEPERARGRFVVARVTVTNQTTRPINSVRSSLVIGQNTYAESSAGFRYGDRDVYPLQPGGSATLTLLYDIPQDAARTALQQGAVELPGSTLDGGGLFDRDEVGRIRLAGAPSAKLAGARSGD